MFCYYVGIKKHREWYSTCYSLSLQYEALPALSMW
uniref:Uncharacterized protein n=1 Tax=Anguilla anguilla TaxID=7936 RepID=A0A0E9W1I6_ANGAN